MSPTIRRTRPPSPRAKTCRHCRQEFEPTRELQAFCSPVCRRLHLRPLEEPRLPFVDATYDLLETAFED
jgi:hypothetical protein